MLFRTASKTVPAKICNVLSYRTTIYFSKKIYVVANISVTPISPI